MDQEKRCKSQMVDRWLKQIEALRKRNVEEEDLTEEERRNCGRKEGKEEDGAVKCIGNGVTVIPFLSCNKSSSFLVLQVRQVWLLS